MGLLIVSKSKSFEILETVLPSLCITGGNLSGYRLDKKKYCAWRYPLNQKIENGIVQTNATHMSPISTIRIMPNGINKNKEDRNAFFLITRMILRSTFSNSVLLIHAYLGCWLNTISLLSFVALNQAIFPKNSQYSPFYCVKTLLTQFLKFKRAIYV